MSIQIRTAWAVCTALVAASAVMSGCGQSDGPTPRTAGTAEACVAQHPIPSVQELQQMLDKALDANTQSKDKTGLLEDGDKDPKLFDQLVQAHVENPEAKWQILDKSKIDSSCVLHVFFTISNGDQHLDEVEIQFIWQDDKWKLSKESVCTLVVGILQKTSPLCVGYNPAFPLTSASLPPGVKAPGTS